MEYLLVGSWKGLSLQRWDLLSGPYKLEVAAPSSSPHPPCPPDEAFEALRIEPFSSPPELPDVMKPQDSGSSANEQAVQ